jgi:putative oxidoreductase
MNTLLHTVIRTDKDLTGLILRVMLGAVMFPHGAQKLLGWFGGHGFSGTMGFFTGSMGIPAVFALLVIIAESFGAIGLITGLLTRVAAFGIGCTMVVAAFMLHVQNGFFMNWLGNQKGEGFEYHVLAVAIAVALIVKGGGLWSLDGLVAARIKNR